MNPPPSRFSRGRGVGGCRPYFFFKRNGRTIPAHGNSVDGGNRVRCRGRGRGFAAPVDQSPHMATSSYLRPQFYAAPENAQQQIKSVAIETPLNCPGWRLYFYKETYDDNSDLSKRIKLLESHFSNNLVNYDLLKIQRQGYFSVKANILRQDEQLGEGWPSLMDDLLYRPMTTLATFSIAMHSMATIAAVDIPPSQEECTKNYYVPKIIKPRKVYARPEGFISERSMESVGTLEIDQLCCVRGVVSSMGSVDASASWIAYRCARCKQEQALKQNGFQVARPNSCKRQDCLAKAGFVELRSSPFTRITAKQMIRLSEARLDGLSHINGLTKNGFNVELRHDLVDTVHLGQEILVTGILRIRALQDQQEYDKYSASAGQMEVFLKASSIVDSREADNQLSTKDVEAIAMINSEPDSFKLLIHSLAPEVHGFEMVKAGALLSLIGGAGSQVHDEETVNVLLVGDPGVGKSNIIEMCSKLSHKASLVQAKRGSSGNGNKLTVAVKGRSNCILESGGLIAARNGICSIDDIDRLTAQQEAFINVLQSQVHCMAYPSLCCTFSTGTSVIASANTMRGQYDHSKLLTENLRIPPNLLSEFHLVFVLLDKPNKEMDTSLTEHVRAVHAGIKKNIAITNRFNKKIQTNNTMNMSIDQQDDGQEYDLTTRLKLTSNDELDLLPVKLMKKFIAYSRQQVKPLFIDEATDLLKNFYMDLRLQSEESLQYSISSSHLAGLIRLCQARARIDFSSEVRKVHVSDVICIVRQSNDDMALSDYIDVNPATSISQRNCGVGIGGGGTGNVRKFVQMLQMRSGALSRRIFEFDELKDMARRVGISCGVTNIIDIVNSQGILLKRGPNMYEVITD